MKKGWKLGAVLLLVLALAGCNSAEGDQGSSDLLGFEELMAMGIAVENGEFQVSHDQLAYALGQALEEEILLAEQSESDDGGELYLYKALDYVELHLFQNEETESLKEIQLFIDKKVVDNPEEIRERYAAALSALLAPESQETLLALLGISDGDAQLTLGGAYYYSSEIESMHMLLTITPAE